MISSQNKYCNLSAKIKHHKLTQTARIKYLESSQHFGQQISRGQLISQIETPYENLPDHHKSRIMNLYHRSS
jgi:hypothetical protein